MTRTRQDRVGRFLQSRWIPEALLTLLAQCSEHPDCILVDGVHTPKNPAAAESFPEWPPSRGEYQRGIPDEEFTARFSALESAVKGTAEAVQALATRMDKQESETQRKWQEFFVGFKEIEGDARDYAKRTEGKVGKLLAEVEGLRAETSSERKQFELLRNYLQGPDLTKTVDAANAWLIHVQHGLGRERFAYERKLAAARAYEQHMAGVEGSNTVLQLSPEQERRLAEGETVTYEGPPQKRKAAAERSGQ